MGQRSRLPRAIATPESDLAHLEQELRKLASRHHLFTVFRHWLELSAYALSNACDPVHREAREAAYMQIVPQYTREELDSFAGLLGHLTLAMEREPRDWLGSLFHCLELHDEAKGQFFSPWPLCQCMARMTVHDAQHLLATQPFLTACEPCAGSGAMMLALAEALREQGINYQQQLHVTAIDIDILCVHMAYIQCTLLHIPAVIYHGDSLRGECWSTWVTPAHVWGFWQVKLARQQEPSIEAAPPQQPDAPSMPEDMGDTAPPATVGSQLVLLAEAPPPRATRKPPARMTPRQPETVQPDLFTVFAQALHR